MRFKHRIGIESELKQIEITPLIDCVFLLLIFFMLTSNFVASYGVKIKFPKASASEFVRTSSATITVSSEDIIYVKGKVYTPEELEGYLKKRKIESIFIRADRDSSLGAVVEIWDVCKRVGIGKISIASTSKE